MGQKCWFYRSAEDWNAMAERLKLMPCPHCKVVGMLIRHGSLYGFDESSPRRKTLRARRVLCSNRNARRGCGRTFSVWLADKIRRLSLSARGLWSFLQRAAVGSIAAAVCAAPRHLSHRTWQRIWKRFDLGQSNIRTALLTRCPPPDLPAGPARRPAAAALVLAHVQAAFANDDSPIARFQQVLHTFFV